MIKTPKLTYVSVTKDPDPTINTNSKLPPEQIDRLDDIFDSFFNTTTKTYVMDSSKKWYH